MITRREAIKTTALITTAAAVMPGALAQTNTAAPATVAPFTLPALPYAVDALEPHIDARTMEIHHDRHHKTYVDGLNKAFMASLPLGYNLIFPMDIESVISPRGEFAKHENFQAAIRNTGGGHYNHSLFWQMMKKDGGGEPKAELAKAIETNFGSFDGFRTKFTEAATKVFGSGWAWLLMGTKDKRLIVRSAPNQDVPFVLYNDAGGPVPEAVNYTPLLCLDVWEHAYYLKYQNKRADYITAWWNVVNWDFVTERYLEKNRK